MKLRGISGVVLAVALTVVSGAAQAYEIVYGTVSRRADGDTVRVAVSDSWSSASRELRVRLVGIDTPETHFRGRAQQPHGDWADEALGELIPIGTEVMVEIFDTDRYGRSLGRIWRDGTDMNRTMVRLGWASPYFICSGHTCNQEFFRAQHVAEYMQDCDLARAEELGIWDSRQPLEEHPFEFRMRIENRRASRYVGDIDTFRLYAPADYTQVDVCRRVFFDNADSGLALGFEY